MSPASVYAVQHVACEPPGLIAETLKAEGLKLDFIRPFRGDRIPHCIGGHAGLVVMGGPMGVYEQTKYPFLRQEIRLIQDTLLQHRPILGVCLGSQLLAAALGVAIIQGKQKEIGWHPVTLARNAAKDVLWRELPESFVAFHWHGDVFELPHGAMSLAWSKLTDCQAFRYGDTAYGLLFHLEVTQRMIARMTRTFRRELQDAGSSERDVLGGVLEYLPRLHSIGRTVFKRWAALVTGGVHPLWNDGSIRAKRVHAPLVPGDGARFLVDRLWPRGVKQDALRLDGWLKDAAPSDGLRRWFDHDPARWTEFRRRYGAELRQRPDALQPIVAAAARGPVTLLYSASDTKHNNAVALIEYLNIHSSRQGGQDA